MIHSHPRYLLAPLAAASVYFPGFSRSLLADDWAVVQRKRFRSGRSRNGSTRTCRCPIAASTPTSPSIVAGHVLRAKPLLTQMVIHPGDVVGGQRDFRIKAIVDQVAVGAVLVAALQHRLQV